MFVEVLSRVIADAASPIGGAITAGRIVSFSRCVDDAVVGLKVFEIRDRYQVGHKYCVSGMTINSER